MSRLIVVDENIPYAEATFGRLGEVTLVPGRRITRECVRNAEALIVRSVTRVDCSLLQGSAVRFVGTATIGYDHVDLTYLRSRDIHFISAPGSNANSVAEYLTAALLEIADHQGIRLKDLVLGVVGVGNVGSRVVKKAEALGMTCLLNDPPKFRETHDPKYLPLGHVLPHADFITVHVPLQREGEDTTWKMVNKKFFVEMKKGARFINTSRGQVVEEEELISALDAGDVSEAVLDVWEGEPAIHPETVARVLLGTPHVAGYSFDGKVAATMMLYGELCRWSGEQPDVRLTDLLPPPPKPEIDLRTVQHADEDVLRELVRQVYDIRIDDRQLRQAAGTGERRDQEFDLLRRNYPQRREFQNTRVLIARNRVPLMGSVRGLGFQVEEV